mgnify:CR=1 FL=1
MNLNEVWCKVGNDVEDKVQYEVRNEVWSTVGKVVSSEVQYKVWDKVRIR